MDQLIIEKNKILYMIIWKYEFALFDQLHSSPRTPLIILTKFHKMYYLFHNLPIVEYF